jgi:hypothetical protein
MGGNLTGGSSAGHSVPANPEALQQIMMIIDDKARSMLQQLPEDTQVDLASCLQAKIESGSVQNPSGWMMKSCMAAGANTGSTPGGNSTAMGGNPMAMRDSLTATPANPAALQQVMMVIDDKAKSLLQQLPYEKQVDLASCLQSKVEEGKVQNPSGWMMKSCMAAGAGNATGMGGNPMAMGGMSSGGLGTRSATPLMPQAVPLAMMVLDEKAKTLLQQLPYEKQVELSSFLQQKMGDGGIRNPSAWMAKSCIAAGAQA